MRLLDVAGYDQCHKRYLCQIEEISRSYLPGHPLVSEDGGVVEVPFDEKLLTRLLGHRGAHLMLAIDEATDAVMGFSEFHTDDADFPEETENLIAVMAQYRPMAWWFYVVKAREYCSYLPGASRVAGKHVLPALCEASFEIMAAAGCRYVVADYMLTPEFCNAGRRLLCRLGFTYAHQHYGKGMADQLVAGDHASCGDTYEIMIRTLQGAR